jgi:general secretion pathway protein G
MIELMAVLIILGLLFTLVATRVADKIDQARVTTTMANLKMLHQAVNQFKMQTGRYPTDEEQLIALIEQPADVISYPEGGFLETTEITQDGWSRDFLYESYPQDGTPFWIVSFGADGEEGGEGNDADLYSTDAIMP